MDVDTVTLFFALLAGLATLVTVAIVVSAAAADRFGVKAGIAPVAVELAAAVAVTATLGSLYLSEIVGYEPCRLCWVQRGFMYPAAVLLVLALVFNRGAGGRLSGPARGFVTGAGLLALVGLPVSVFHRYEQAAGGVGEFCDQDNPCSLRWVEEFGVVTIPVMAGVGFATIVTLVVVALTRPATPADNHHRTEEAPPTELEHH